MSSNILVMDTLLPIALHVVHMVLALLKRYAHVTILNMPDLLAHPVKGSVSEYFMMMILYVVETVIARVMILVDVCSVGLVNNAIFQRYVMVCHQTILMRASTVCATKKMLASATRIGQV